MGLPHQPVSLASRRRFLIGVTCSAVALSAESASAHNEAGRVDPPQPPPATNLKLEDDTTSTLAGVLLGHVTAVQLMFTSCQATCPIQGALFGEAVKKLGDGNKLAQFLSISIDPAHDTPAALREWLNRFGRSPRWRGAQPEKQQLEGLTSFLKSKNPGPDPHTAQVYFFNRKAELVMRSVDFPPASEIVARLELLANKK
jgi:protein SCO1/2